jgi:predicted amidohydrolase
MRVAALQTEIEWEDPRATFRRIVPWLEAAASAGARLVALPEMFACGFSMAAEAIAEPPGGPTTEFLTTHAERLGVWLAGSLPERPAGARRPSNTLVLAGPHGELHRYRKIHPFSFAGEHEHYEAGSERVVVEVEGVRLGLFVCYDLRFADEFWALAPEVDAYLVVANWPDTRRHHWTSLLVARAIENQAYVIGVNRVGTGGLSNTGSKLRYTGDSRIVDPMGEVLAAGSTVETMLVAEVDPAVVADVRARLPFLADRR